MVADDRIGMSLFTLIPQGTARPRATLSQLLACPLARPRSAFCDPLAPILRLCRRDGSIITSELEKPTTGVIAAINPRMWLTRQSGQSAVIRDDDKTFKTTVGQTGHHRLAPSSSTHVHG